MLPHKKVKCDCCKGKGFYMAVNVHMDTICANCKEPFRDHCDICDNHHYNGKKFVPALCEKFVMPKKEAA